MKLHIVVLDFRWHTVPSGRNIIEQRISVFECHCMSVCVFFEGSVGTRARAQPALFSDVGETCVHCVWTPLASAGCSCCGQTGRVKFKAQTFE